RRFYIDYPPDASLQKLFGASGNDVFFSMDGLSGPADIFAWGRIDGRGNVDCFYRYFLFCKQFEEQGYNKFEVDGAACGNLGGLDIHYFSNQRADRESLCE